MTAPISLLIAFAAFAWSAPPGLSAGDQNTATSEASVPDAKELGDIWPPLSDPRTGDLDAMISRGEVRVLTTFSLGFYHIDRGKQRGVTYEILSLLEEALKEKAHAQSETVRLVILPVRRDQLLPFLKDGYGDVVAAQWRISPELEAEVDFSTPFFDEHREYVVTGPAAPDISGLSDLSGRSITVRAASSYALSLRALNDRLDAEGLAPVAIVEAEPELETEDLLEMVDAGILPMTVADGFRVRLWTEVYDTLKTSDDLIVSDGGQLAMALRKGSPQLKAFLDAYITEHQVGALIPNVILQRYRDDTDWTGGALKRDPFRDLETVEALFRKYGEQYGFDWLLLTCLAIQESGLDQSVRSQAGAVGIMQVLPSTAADPSVGIPDIGTVENNIHAGTKYLSVLRDQYFADEALDPFERALFTFAGYNAGPNRINRLREDAAARGLDPNRWFNNVELVVASSVGREPVDYVGNIYKYYAAYKLALED